MAGPITAAICQLALFHVAAFAYEFLGTSCPMSATWAGLIIPRVTPVRKIVMKIGKMPNL